MVHSKRLRIVIEANGGDLVKKHMMYAFNLCGNTNKLVSEYTREKDECNRKEE